MSHANPRRNDKIQYVGNFPGLHNATGIVMAVEPAVTHSWECLVLVRDNRSQEHTIPVHYYEIEPL